jgi:hypothetical protein
MLACDFFVINLVCGDGREALLLVPSYRRVRFLCSVHHVDRITSKCFDSCVSAMRLKHVSRDCRLNNTPNHIMCTIMINVNQ